MKHANTKEHDNFRCALQTGLTSTKLTNTVGETRGDRQWMMRDYDKNFLLMPCSEVSSLS